jgi:PTS system D-glucosamine-specific IIC component
LFTLLIRKLDLKTPGREDSEEVRLYGQEDLKARNKRQG